MDAAISIEGYFRGRGSGVGGAYWLVDRQLLPASGPLGGHVCFTAFSIKVMTARQYLAALVLSPFISVVYPHQEACFLPRPLSVPIPHPWLQHVWFDGHWMAIRVECLGASVGAWRVSGSS